ncbi:MAG TPA: PH domain-containing protein [Verrucomicrobiae bacterium]|jgi:uncharacterized membrane protein YdbT with pleckstrin-like domain|nr:PH domain-containing protein [Verrucomicrobiae bacterium]
MGYVERHLLAGEHVLYKTRLHWILFLRPALLMLIGIALGVACYQKVPQPPWLWLIGPAIVLVGVGFGLVHWVELMTSEFAVTSSRVIFKVGLIARYTTELLLAKVESIGVQQGLLGRLVNYGDITVIGTGGTREVFRRVRDPVGFRNHVQQASIDHGALGGTSGAVRGPERRA